MRQARWKKGPIHGDMMVKTQEQSAKVAQPSEGALDLPTLAVATQGTPVVERGFAPLPAMRTDEQDAALEQSPAQGITVLTAVGDYAQRSLLRSATASAWHGNPRQRAFGQGYFPRTGRDQLASQRNTLAVDHHHPLRAFARCRHAIQTPSRRACSKSTRNLARRCGFSPPGQGPGNSTKTENFVGNRPVPFAIVPAC
jgi:hypothetical protein